MRQLPILGAVPRMPPDDVRIVIGLPRLHLWPGERGITSTVAQGTGRLVRLLVTDTPDRFRKPDRRWGRARRIAWLSIPARARMGDALSVTRLSLNGSSPLALPGSLDTCLFAPTAVDCALDFGVTKAGDVLSATFRNDGHRPVTVCAAFIATPEAKP
jgi:hypothetical protein